MTLLRVVIPWMIGRAFERVGDDTFMAMVAERLNEVKPVPPEVLQELDPVVQKLLAALTNDTEFLAIVLTEFRKEGERLRQGASGRGGDRERGRQSSSARSTRRSHGTEADGARRARRSRSARC